jgi:hypothetical protein
VYEDEQDLPPGSRLVVRIWLPDRPGALGLVASRIGALGADIVGIDVLERSEHIAVDEFAVVLPDDNLVGLLVREIEEVDGVSVEEWTIVQRFPDPRIDALEAVRQICRSRHTEELLSQLATSVRSEFAADWAAVLRHGDIVASDGDGVPRPTVLAAVAAGTSVSPAVVAGHGGPEDLAVASLEEHGITLMAGRAGHPFRRRERRQLIALARIADRVGTLLPDGEAR